MRAGVHARGLVHVDRLAVHGVIGTLQEAFGVRADLPILAGEARVPALHEAGRGLLDHPRGELVEVQLAEPDAGVVRGDPRQLLGGRGVLAEQAREADRRGALRGLLEDGLAVHPRRALHHALQA
jgi:hypothetical protein